MAFFGRQNPTQAYSDGPYHCVESEDELAEIDGLIRRLVSGAPGEPMRDCLPSRMILLDACGIPANEGGFRHFWALRAAASVAGDDEALICSWPHRDSSGILSASRKRPFTMRVDLARLGDFVRQVQTEGFQRATRRCDDAVVFASGSAGGEWICMSPSAQWAIHASTCEEAVFGATDDVMTYYRKSNPQASRDVYEWIEEEIDEWLAAAKNSERRRSERRVHPSVVRLLTHVYGESGPDLFRVTPEEFS